MQRTQSCVLHQFVKIKSFGVLSVIQISDKQDKQTADMWLAQGLMSFDELSHSISTKNIQKQTQQQLNIPLSRFLKSISDDVFLEKYQKDNFFRYKVQQIIEKHKNCQLEIPQGFQNKTILNFQNTLIWQKILAKIIDQAIFLKWKTLINKNI